jgi:hypothetical protein
MLILTHKSSQSLDVKQKRRVYKRSSGPFVWGEIRAEKSCHRALFHLLSTYGTKKRLSTKPLCVESMISMFSMFFFHYELKVYNKAKYR